MLNFCDFIQVYVFTTNNHLSDMGFTAHKHKNAKLRRIGYKIIRPICKSPK